MANTEIKRGLQEAKLKGLVRSILGPDEAGFDLIDAPGAVGGIVASRGFCLLVADPKTGSQIRSLGQALIWADRAQVSELNVLAEADDAADLARRAGLLDPSPIVWEIKGAQLQLAEFAALEPAPELALEELEFSPVMKAAGTRPIDDHGRLVAEVAGLEVARVSSDEEGAYLEVGVGQADRELQMLVHGGLERQEALERAVGMVLEHRRLNAPLHPLNRLARERWLRSEILDQPSLVGLTSVEPLPPLRPRSTLLGTEPSAAIGMDEAGRQIIVVCSVGVDVDLTAEAAEYRQRSAPGAELLLVVPKADQHPAVVRTVKRLHRASFVSFPPPWGTPL